MTSLDRQYEAKQEFERIIALFRDANRSRVPYSRALVIGWIAFMLLSSVVSRRQEDRNSYAISSAILAALAVCVVVCWVFFGKPKASRAAVGDSARAPGNTEPRKEAADILGLLRSNQRTAAELFQSNRLGILTQCALTSALLFDCVHLVGPHLGLTHPDEWVINGVIGVAAAGIGVFMVRDLGTRYRAHEQALQAFIDRYAPKPEGQP